MQQIPRPKATEDDNWYMGFSGSTTVAQAAAAFRAKYGADPYGYFIYGPSLYVGPIPADQTDDLHVREQ